MSRKKYEYNILSDDFCIYCQKQFASPGRLQSHILSIHKNTYAANSIIQARAKLKVEKK